MHRVGRFIALAYIAVALSPLVAVALYSVVSFASIVLGGAERDWWQRDAVTSPERVAALAKRGLIEQLVTFDQPIGLRKDNPQSEQFNLYAIGVRQTTLPEEITPVAMFRDGPVPPFFERPKADLAYASSNPVVGQFNNIILYEPKSGKLTPVFSARLAVSEFKFTSGPDFDVLMVLATDQDTDKDGKLGGRDRHDLYIFSIRDGTLHNVGGLNGNPLEIVDMPGEPFVVMRTEIDVGNAEEAKATDRPDIPKPSRLYRVDLRSYAAEPMVPADMLERLQRTLDGRPPTSGPAK